MGLVFSTGVVIVLSPRPTPTLQAHAEKTATDVQSHAVDAELERSRLETRLSGTAAELKTLQGG